MEKIPGSRLIGDDGKPLYGIHERPIEDLNIQDFRFHGKDKVSRLKNELLKDFLLKRWQYLGVCTPEVIFGIAVVHLGYISNIFAYVFDRKDKTLTEFNTNQALGANTVFEGSLMEGKSSYQSGKTEVLMINSADHVRLTANIKNKMNVSLRFAHIIEPLSIVTRVGLTRFNYTNKESGLPVEGSISASGHNYTIDPHQPSGVIDYTYGYLERLTFWNWASGGGFDKNKRRIGFNLVQGVNETGFTENAFWINGKMVKTDVIDFEYNDRNILSPWKIRSNDGKVKLVFHPEGERASSLNLGVISSRFRQPFGRFTGELRDGWSKIILQEVSGFAEEHESKW